MIIIPTLFIGAFELPLYIAAFDKGDSDFPFDSGLGFIGPF